MLTGGLPAVFRHLLGDLPALTRQLFGNILHGFRWKLSTHNDGHYSKTSLRRQIDEAFDLWDDYKAEYGEIF